VGLESDRLSDKRFSWPVTGSWGFNLNSSLLSAGVLQPLLHQSTSHRTAAYLLHIRRSHCAGQGDVFSLISLQFVINRAPFLLQADQQFSNTQLDILVHGASSHTSSVLWCLRLWHLGGYFNLCRGFDKGWEADEWKGAQDDVGW